MPNCAFYEVFEIRASVVTDTSPIVNVSTR